MVSPYQLVGSKCRATVSQRNDIGRMHVDLPGVFDRLNSIRYHRAVLLTAFGALKVFVGEAEFGKATNALSADDRLG